MGPTIFMEVYAMYMTSHPRFMTSQNSIHFISLLYLISNWIYRTTHPLHLCIHTQIIDHITPIVCMITQIHWVSCQIQSLCCHSFSVWDLIYTEYHVKNIAGVLSYIQWLWRHKCSVCYVVYSGSVFRNIVDVMSWIQSLMSVIVVVISHRIHMIS